ncbi:MAG: DUF6168 family protein [Bacteroidota bacterium]
MIKALLKQTALFCLAFIVVYFAQYTIIEDFDVIRFNVLDVDVFFVMSSLIICLHFLFLSNLSKVKPQLGFIYLPTLFIKGILFYLFFKDTVFKIEIFNMVERLNLLFPLTVFLTLEVYLIAKILNKK